MDAPSSVALARPGPPAPGGPIPLTLRQAGIAAALVLAVALATSLLLPVAAAVQARRVVPPGAVVVGGASFLPADGWGVVESGPDAVVLARAGSKMLVRYDEDGDGGGDPLVSLRALADRTAAAAPQVRPVGGVRTFRTVTEDVGYLQAFASPGTTGALAVVARAPAEGAAAGTAAGPQVLVEAVGPATSFAPLSGQVSEMVAGMRLLRQDGS